MRSKRRTHAAIAAVVIGTIILALSTSVGQNRRNYDVEAQVYTTPEYRTDASRAIDAYERVMERYMDATEQGLRRSVGPISACGRQTGSCRCQAGKAR